MSVVKSIADIQSEAEAALASLANVPLGMLPPCLEGLRHFAPPAGFGPAVSLRSSSDRQIKRNADAANWDPKTGVVEIRFAPSASSNAASEVTAGAGSNATGQSIINPANVGCDDSVGGAVSPEVSELVMALDAAEREPRFREFVGIKQFRDLYLPGRGLVWAVEPAERHRVLALAIEQDLILKGSVVNPRFPAYPTTSVRVNRNHLLVQQLLHRQTAERSTFTPISMSGEPLSQTVLADRR
jgi:hypothetical protein